MFISNLITCNIIELIPKDKFIYISNNSLNLIFDTKEDRVSLGQTIRFSVRIHIGLGILFIQIIPFGSSDEI